MKTILPVVLLLLGITTSGARDIRAFRDRQIIIEEFIARDMPLDEVLTKLEDASTEADRNKVGIRIVNLLTEPLRSHRITIAIRKESVRRIVELIADPLALWVSSDGNTIEIRKSERITRDAQPSV